MNKIFRRLAIAAAVLLPATGALATTFSFASTDGYGARGDMMDLEHGYYYGWSIVNPAAAALGAELRSGRAAIQSAKLEFKNIYNWTYEPNDQLNSFLLAAPPPLPGRSETVPVVINGVTQGRNVYTYEKTLTTTNTTGTRPSGYTLTGSVVTYNAKLKRNVTTYTYSKVVTKTNLTGVPPAGYTLASERFVADTVTLGNGIQLSSDLWERSDQQSLTDIDWGVEAYRIRDINDDPLNPWHDPLGGQKRSWTLTYQLDDLSINKLFEYSMDGSFGIGIDPDCHYFNDGVTLTVVTAPIPEPETYAMMLAGLGLMGLVARRRKQRASH